MKIPKWIIAIFVCSFVIAGGLWVSNRLSRSLRYFSLMNFVATDYMPTQRRLTKKWPDTLSLLPSSLLAGEPFVLRDELIEIYRDYDVTLEVVLMCEDSYVYRLHSKYFSSTCKSTIKPDNGYCYFDQD